MNRRAFFGLIAAGLAAAQDPERLLWVPGRRSISIPPPITADTPGLVIWEEMSLAEFRRRYPDRFHMEVRILS